MHRKLFRVLLLSAFCLAPAVRASAQDDPDFGFGGESGQSDDTPQMQRVDPRMLNAWQRNEKDDAENISSLLAAKIRRKLTCGIETVGQLADGNAPLWLTSGRQGLSSPKNAAGYFRASMLGGMHLPTGLLFDYGMDVAVTAGHSRDYIIQQAYIDVGYNWFDLSLGMKERWGEVSESRLSTGSLTWSGNSSPIPQIRLEVPEFTRLSILGGWFSLKGHVAYGWYLDNDWRLSQAEKQMQPATYVDGILHHSKAAFLKVGDAERFPLEMIFGLEMYSQFGGEKHTLYNDHTASESLPHDLKACWQILLPFNAVGEQTKENGNSLGSWHLAFDLTLDKWKARAYYEHFYEDHSSMLGIEYKSDLEGNRDYVFYGFRRNWFDGLFGLQFDMPENWPVRQAVLEVLNTRGQCGPVYRAKSRDYIKEGVDGRDGFYTNEIYDSYSYYGQNAGNPVLVSPMYNSDGDLRLKSNRVLAYHIGIEGSAGPQIDWKLMATRSTHWGTYEVPFQESENITSLLLGAYYWLGGTYSWKIGLELAADKDSGSLLGNNKGIMISISKLWKLL